jgi:hypothetical protein
MDLARSAGDESTSVAGREVPVREPMPAGLSDADAGTLLGYSVRTGSGDSA